MERPRRDRDPAGAARPRFANLVRLAVFFLRPAVPAALLGAAILLAAGSPAAANPNLAWTDLYDGGALSVDYGTTALVDGAGNLIVGGEINDGVDGSDILIRQLDRTDASAAWTCTYSAFDGNDMAITQMVWDGAGDILVGGYIRACDG